MERDTDDEHEPRRRGTPETFVERRRDSKDYRRPGNVRREPVVVLADDAVERGPRRRKPSGPTRHGSRDHSYRHPHDEAHLMPPWGTHNTSVVDRPQHYFDRLHTDPLRPRALQQLPRTPRPVRHVRPREGPGVPWQARETLPSVVNPGLFQAMWNSTEPQDVTVHLELPITDDFDTELEEFSRLKRLGNFKAAKDYFRDKLETYIGHPYVFVQYAETLLAMGDFQSFKLLDAEPIFGNASTASSCPSSDSDEDDDPVTARLRGCDGYENKIQYDELDLVEANWKLLEVLAAIHRDGTVNEAMGVVDEALESFQFRTTIGSTEIQIVSLVLQLVRHISRSYERCDRGKDFKQLAQEWIDWSKLYDNLQAQGRIWDFRDVFMAAAAAFGIQQTCEMFLGTRKWRDHIVGDWKLDEKDESTNLACLDILMSMVFTETVVEVGVPGENLSRIFEYLRAAGPFAENLIKHSSKSMKSRPFSQWIMAKAAESECTRGQRPPDPDYEPFYYVWCSEGLSLRKEDWSGLPIYAPLGTENPRWQVPQASPKAIEPMYMALNVAKELQDYTTQVLCYKMLILRSQDPSQLFRKLADLQKTSQGDNLGHLRTLAASYLACKDRHSRIQLLDELKATDDWLDGSVLRDPLACCARDFIQRALALQVGGRGTGPPLEKSGIATYPWLPRYVQGFLRKASERGILPPVYDLPLNNYSGRGHPYRSHYYDYPLFGYDDRRPAPPVAPPAPPRPKNSQTKNKVAFSSREGPGPSGTQQGHSGQGQTQALVPYNQGHDRKSRAPKWPGASDEGQVRETPGMNSPAVSESSSFEWYDGTSVSTDSVDEDVVTFHHRDDRVTMVKAQQGEAREPKRQERRESRKRAELEAVKAELESCKAELRKSKEKRARQGVDGETSGDRKRMDAPGSRYATGDGQQVTILEEPESWNTNRGRRVRPESRTIPGLHTAGNMSSQGFEPECPQATERKTQEHANIRARSDATKEAKKTKGKGTHAETNPNGANLGDKQNASDVRGNPSTQTNNRQNEPGADLGTATSFPEAPTAESRAIATAAQNERIGRRPTTVVPNQDGPSQGPANHEVTGAEGPGEQQGTDWDNLAAEQRAEIATRPSEGRGGMSFGAWSSTGVWDGWDEIVRNPSKRTVVRPGMDGAATRRPSTHSTTFRRMHGDARLMDTASPPLSKGAAGAARRASRRDSSGYVDLDRRFHVRTAPPIETPWPENTSDRDGEQADNEGASGKKLGNWTSRAERREATAGYDAVARTGQFQDQTTTQQEPDKERRSQDGGERRVRSPKMAETSCSALDGGVAASAEQARSNGITGSAKPDPHSEPEQRISRKPTVTDPSPGEE